MPPRGYRLTARKRVPNHNSNLRSPAESLSSTLAANSASEITGPHLPSPGVSVSPECYQDAVSTPTSVSIGDFGKVPHSTTTVISPALQSEDSEKTLGTDSGLVKPDKKLSCGGVEEKLGNSMVPENMGVERSVSEEIVRVPNVAPSASGSGDGSKISLLSEVRPQFEEECSVLPLTGPNSAVSGKKKIVRKTVKKIVKKVIKKRVPKRVLSESERTGMASTVDEGKEISNATEHLSVVNDPSVVEKSKEVMEKASVADGSTQKLKLVDGASVLEPIVGEKRGNPSSINSMEAEIFGFQFGTSVPEQVSEKSSDDRGGINATDTNGQGIDAEDSAEVIKVEYPTKTVMDIKEMEAFVMENQSEGSFVENLCMVDVTDDERITAQQNVVAEEENDEVLAVEGSERKIEKSDCGNSEMESDSNRSNELILSGELEALERRKKRKTEVFVGGLDKYTNEDEIRKVFVEIGEVLEVRLAKSGQTGKNKGFAFVRFASAADAKKALESYSQVEIRGKLCGVVPVEGNDTLFLGNIDRNWKSEDVVTLLEKAGIEKIDNVNLKIDPRNIQKNRGFAFVEFETCRDAQVAFHKLQKKDAFGSNVTVKVEWAEPLDEPDEQELLKVKAVYAEFLPSTWGEEKVRKHFKRFGEIESVFLAKDIPSSRRKDYAFINYTTRDAAIACIEALNREKLKDGCSKVNIAVSLAKPIPKSKQMKHTSDLTINQLPKAKQIGLQTSKKIHKPRKKLEPARSSHRNIEIDNEPSTTDELVQILRQQASSARIPPHPRTATRGILEYDFPVPGSKRPYSVMPHEPVYTEPPALLHARMENSYPISGPSSSSYAVDQLSFPHHQGRPGFTSEPDNRRRFYTDDYQTAGRDPYYGNTNIYRRY